jgi:predicted RNase H-like HicB family nuclease
MRFTAVVTREGKWFVARCLEVEVASQGEAVESALANLREALELKLEDEPAVTVPQDGPLVTTVEVTPRSSAA